MDIEEKSENQVVDNDNALIDELTSNAIENESEIAKVEPKKKKNKKPEVDYHDEDKIFRRYKIKDIVFLAIMACCTLLTGAIMPLLTNIPIFGIIQMCLGLQFSIFPAIGLMKVRKVGSLTFLSLVVGLFLVFMFPPMFFIIVICAVVTELLVILIFRGYKKDIACWFAAAIFMPLTIPLYWIYYNTAIFSALVGELSEGTAIWAYANSNPLTICLITLAVVAICAAGSFIGWLISHELIKNGVMKK